MCKGSSSVSVDSFAEDFGGNENLVGTGLYYLRLYIIIMESIQLEVLLVILVAHELGHNFGLYHDGQSGPASSCGAEDGLMGYGSTKDRFSTCSLQGMVSTCYVFKLYFKPFDKRSLLLVTNRTIISMDGDMECPV